jgi:hypothetical protein
MLRVRMALTAPLAVVLVAAAFTTSMGRTNQATGADGTGTWPTGLLAWKAFDVGDIALVCTTSLAGFGHQPVGALAPEGGRLDDTDEGIASVLRRAQIFGPAKAVILATGMRMRCASGKLRSFRQQA